MHAPLLSRTRALGLAVLSLSAVSATAQSLMLTRGQVVAEPGDTPGGVPAGQTFLTTAFDFPLMSRDGNILFRGRLSGTGVTALNDRALFIGRTKADLTVLLRAGDADPTGLFPNSVVAQVSTGTGMPSGTDLFSNPRISPQGNKVLFHAQLYDGGNPGSDSLVHTTAAGTINDGVIYTGTPGALQLLAQQATTTMPGGAALNFNSALVNNQSLTAFNSNGTAVFKSALVGGDVSGSTNSTAWIIGSPGSLSYLLRGGDLVLGGVNGVEPGGLGSNCVINEAGDVLHDETLSLTLGSSPATAANDKILFITLAGSGVHGKLAREGDTAVDSTGAALPGVIYGDRTLCKGFGPAATAAFHCTLTGAVSATDDRAIFAGGLGSLKMTARKGQVVPGTGGETIGVITLNGVYSEQHGVLFGGTLVVAGAVTVNNDSFLAVAANDGSGLTTIAREGDACPGLPGFTFGIVTGTYNLGASGAHNFNDRGQVLIQTFVRDLTSQALVLYSWDPVHGLQLQMMAGDTMGGSTVTVPGIPISQASGDGNGLAFNENGDFVARTTTSAGQFIGRGHIGSLHGLPSAVPVGGGVPHVFEVDCGPTQAGQLYLLLATSFGTEPGFVSPFGGQLVPLNPDPIWTDLSLNNPNSIVWPGSLGFLDGQGKNLSPASFVMPPGFPVFQGITLHHACVAFDISMGLVTTFASEPTPCYLY